ncbi:hypothetical protein [Streptomyces lunaelactis]|nr:hypothetical protein [Streptomyces lunaelactis]
MSPMWDPPEHGAGDCSACGQHTDNGLVHWVPRMSAPDVRLVIHGEPADCRPPAATPHRLPSAPVHP